MTPEKDDSVLKSNTEVSAEELDQDNLIKHNIEGAIMAVTSLNKDCSYVEATETVKNFIDHLIDLRNTSIKPPDWNEKSTFIPFYNKHDIYEIQSGDKKKKIKMSGEANVTYAAGVLQNKLQTTLINAFDELKTQIDSLLVEYEKRKTDIN
ncbi:MAG: hypothetical protein Q8L47_02705 [bacterium]|nr:hypothetical protein [bacterium]